MLVMVYFNLEKSQALAHSTLTPVLGFYSHMLHKGNTTTWSSKCKTGTLVLSCFFQFAEAVFLHFAPTD